MQVCTSLHTDNHASTQPLTFLQARCPSCRPTNSVKALQAYYYYTRYLSGGVLMWLSVWSKVLTCIWPSWCHCHSLSLASVRSRLVLPFWYRLTWVVPEKEPLNGCVCVFVSFSVCRCLLFKKSLMYQCGVCVFRYQCSYGSECWVGLFRLH